MFKNKYPVIAVIQIMLFLATNAFGLELNSFNKSVINTIETSASNAELSLVDQKLFVESNTILKRKDEKAFLFKNPLLINSQEGCSVENLNTNRFDNQFDLDSRLAVCDQIETVSDKLSENWSPELHIEMQDIWQIFLRENIKIRPIKKNVSKRILAIAEAFTENESGLGFTASFYLRPQQIRDETFFPIFMHELRHIYDFYQLYKSHSTMTKAELEKRGFRIMGKISQENNENPQSTKIPVFWEAAWKNLSPFEIEQKRDEKIDKFMKTNSLYKKFLKSPENYLVGYLSNQFISQKEDSNNALKLKLKNNENGERLPNRIEIRQTNTEIPQNVKEVAFTTEKASNLQNPAELLLAALKNEKNLYQKMDNFVYEENLQLQCWKKQQVVENYDLKWLVARTNNGNTLVQNLNPLSNSVKQPECVQNIDLIKTDATETFWAAPYLDQMPIKFEYFTVIDGISVARYTVLQPTMDKFNQIAAQYSKIKSFRAFIGTIFVSVADSQIIKFWGTSFPEQGVSGNQANRTYSSYCATAVRQKLVSGIWVTTLLNTVAVTNQGTKMKPFSYVVKYQNYRQGDSEVKISDDIEKFNQ